MKVLPTAKETVTSLLQHMVLRFEGEKYPDLEAVYQFVFTDIDGGFPVYLKFSKGKAGFFEGSSENPSVTIRTPSGIWLDISGGHRNPVWALLTRKYTAEGKLSSLRLLPNLLTKRRETPVSKTFPGEWTSPSRVLVLIGNPRKKNGLTYFYLQPFLEGMQTSGATIEEIFLYEKKINQCMGCFHCWTRTPGRCIQKDDQAELIEKLDTADLIIYALPLYYHSVPGLVKAHLDRQLPRVHPFVERTGAFTRHPRRTSVRQNIVLFSICGFPELGQFDPLVATFEAYARHDNTSLIAKVLIPGAMELYYNPTSRTFLLDKLDHLRSAGKEIMKSGTLKRGTLKGVSKIPRSSHWHDGANIYWHNEMGKLLQER